MFLKIVTLLFSIYFLIHSVRNILQYKGIKNIFTEFNHQFGIKSTNLILGLFGLVYKQDYEKYFALLELTVSIVLFLIYLKI